MAEIEKEKEANVEKARIQLLAENEEELKTIKEELDSRMKKEEEVIEKRMGDRRDQILGLKRQNLEDRLKVVAGEMSDLQIKELRAQFEREFDQLEKTIAEEKSKQLANMRAAMLNRRIVKERKRKQEKEEADKEQQRQRVARMTGKMAKAFRKMIKAEADKQQVDV